MTISSDGKHVSRVVMLWPSDLKAAVQARAGKRGLTAYVLDAVRLKREQEEAVECLSCKGTGVHTQDCWLRD